MAGKPGQQRTGAGAVDALLKTRTIPSKRKETTTALADDTHTTKRARISPESNENAKSTAEPIMEGVVSSSAQSPSGLPSKTESPAADNKPSTSMAAETTTPSPPTPTATSTSLAPQSPRTMTEAPPSPSQGSSNAAIKAGSTTRSETVFGRAAAHLATRLAHISDKTLTAIDRANNAEQALAWLQAAFAQEVADRTDTIDGLQQAITELVSHAAELRGANEALRERNADLAARAAALQRSSGELRVEMAVLEDINGELRDRYAALVAYVENLRRTPG